jgi:hypothetical protein
MTAAIGSGDRGMLNGNRDRRMDRGISKRPTSIDVAGNGDLTPPPRWRLLSIAARIAVDMMRPAGAARSARAGGAGRMSAAA